MKRLLPERTSTFFNSLIARNADIAQLIVRETRQFKACSTVLGPFHRHDCNRNRKGSKQGKGWGFTQKVQCSAVFIEIR